ncbi:hypothetical protein ACO34A_18655 [Rhizobium sp. ACO-34A]|nr:hypothetical protein ACO34A_18655 [Rhizobium sp. ACO-34A]
MKLILVSPILINGIFTRVGGNGEWREINQTKFVDLDGISFGSFNVCWHDVSHGANDCAHRYDMLLHNF